MEKNCGGLVFLIKKLYRTVSARILGKLLIMITYAGHGKNWGPWKKIGGLVFSIQKLYRAVSARILGKLQIMIT